MTALTSASWLTTFESTASSSSLRSTVRVYAPTGTAGPAITSLTGFRRRSKTERIPAGFDLGTISASRFEVKVTGLSTSLP